MAARLKRRKWRRCECENLPISHITVINIAFKYTVWKAGYIYRWEEKTIIVMTHWRTRFYLLYFNHTHQPFLSYLARGVTLKLLIGTDLTVLIERLWQINNRGRPLWYTCPQPRCGADLKQCCQGTFLQLMSEWADWLYLSQLCRMGHCVRRSQGDISDYLCWSRWTCSGVCASVCLTCTVQLRRPPTCPWRSGLRFFSAASRLLCACVSYTRKCEQSTRQSGRHVFSSITSWHHEEDKWQRQTNAKQIICE